MKFSAINAIRGLVHLVYPKLCVACEEETPLKGAPFCLMCKQEMYYTELHNERNNEFESHFLGRIDLERGAAMFYYRKDTAIQKLMHDFKYKSRSEIGLQLGAEYGAILKESGFMHGITAIAPVPLHWRKQKARGYNQAEVFAKGISLSSGVKLYEDFLFKPEENESQTSKSRGERVDNVEKVYKLNEDYEPKGEHILLIDDVLTTGATLEACAKKIPSGNKVSMVTMAIGRM